MIKKSMVLLMIIPTLLYSDIRTPRTPRAEDEPVNLPAFRREQKIEKKRKDAQKEKKGIMSWFTPKLTYTEMNFAELKEATLSRIEKEQWDVAIRYLERLIILCEDINEKAELIVQLGDIQFKQGFFDDAAAQYKEFIHLYPGNKHSEYAHYQSILCTSKRMLSPDRDQTKTEETIELANKFLEQTTFNQYRDQVVDIRGLCYQTLGHSELNVGDFYIKQGNYLAAQRRLESIRTDWLPKAPEIEFRLAQLESTLSLEFADFIPPQSSTLVAQTVQPKKTDMAARF